MGGYGHSAWRARGAALVTSLCLMLAVLVAGVSAARTATGAARAEQRERDRLLALQAAEAALADAERDIEGAANPASARADSIAAPAAFVEGCGHGDTDLGLCRLALSTPVWQRADLAGDDSVVYGRFTGAIFPAVGGAAPRYIIEMLQPPASGMVYRITAIGFGPRDDERVVLQSAYRKAGQAPGARVSWREISNWAELHQAALE